MNSSVSTIGGFLYTCLAAYAIYLSFKCNGGFNLMGFLGALIFGPFYIAYKLATMPKKCGLHKS